jgi:hypothetical protein
MTLTFPLRRPPGDVRAGLQDRVLGHDARGDGGDAHTGGEGRRSAEPDDLVAHLEPVHVRAQLGHRPGEVCAQALAAPSWIYPRDPDFAAKAARALDLYAGYRDGDPLGPGEFVICADEKTSIQARCRCHPTFRWGRPG